MTRYILIPMVALALLPNAALAQTTTKQGTIKKTSPIDGKAMFDQYCVVCHGQEGTGNGAAAADLKKPPADLTKIAARNGGTFPEVKVARYIKGQDEADSHDRRDMPLWGDLFRSLGEDTAALRVNALVKYVKGIQTK